MITITYVKCDRDLLEARVGISVLPENYTGTALRELKKNTQNMVDILKKRINLRRVPHFYWEVDKIERRAWELEKTLGQIQKDDDEKGEG
jgi:ribosome-binding factor A